MTFSNLSIDFFLIVSAIITIIFYTKKGFMRSFLGLSKVFASIVIAYFLSPFFVSRGDGLKEVGVKSILASILSFIIIFIISLIVLSILSFFVAKIADLPILKQLDRVLGFVLGLIRAALNLVVICFIITIVIKVLSIFNPDVSYTEIAGNTLIYGFISRFDFISYLLLII